MSILTSMSSFAASKECQDATIKAMNAGVELGKVVKFQSEPVGSPNSEIYRDAWNEMYKEFEASMKICK